MPTLHQLEHLLALDDTRHFAKAASKVHLSQPAFSRSIQALEKQTGLVLFERGAGEIKPTPAGRFLISRARQVVQEARSLQKDIELFQLGEAGELAFGVGPFPCATLAGSVLALLRNKRPLISIRTEVGSPALLLNLLVKEEIDFFVADNQQLEVAPYLNVEVLTRQYGHLYARKNHPLHQRPHTFRDAWEFGLASVKLPDSMKYGLYQLLELQRQTMPRPALECDDIKLLHQVALQTNTVLASTDLAAKPWLASGDLVRLNTLDFPEVFANICMVSLRDRALSEIAVHAMDQFRIVGQQDS